MLGTVQFEIKSGEFSDVISQKLFEIGLVADATAFNQYLSSIFLSDVQNEHLPLITVSLK
mgnify:CR=1 FL=1